jgi:ribosome recycling factor
VSVSSILADAESRMKKSVDAANTDFQTLRTGRATPALLDTLKVDYYGQQMPVNQLGTINIPEARVLIIEPWDRAALQAIEKAIMNSQLGLAPNNDGTRIRLNIPPLTEERRKDMVKQLRQKAEAGRVSLRNIRRDANDSLKKDEEVTEDEAKRAEKDVQKLLDKYVAELDSLEKSKEEELLEN